MVSKPSFARVEVFSANVSQENTFCPDASTSKSEVIFTVMCLQLPDLGTPREVQNTQVYRSKLNLQA